MEIMQTTEQLRHGMAVVAGNEAIGELIDTFGHEDVTYLHVRRFGPGMDDLYVPSIAIARVMPKHIYLTVAPEDLVAQAWHDRPGG